MRLDGTGHAARTGQKRTYKMEQDELFSPGLVRSTAKVAQIGADVRDLGFPDFPSFQEAVAAPPPGMPLLPQTPTFPDLENPRLPVAIWPSLPGFLPFPFTDQSPPSEPFGPRVYESDNWLPSTPSNPQGFP
ncbi:unnamed protein product [Microthlaspi erraticum]|uniref:Uncharacterized protein n=1 Tax=Microthlaspi erraticum TaxID=1685480 RepID=A0A6D2K8Q4_9BRAS|nr:unnamed protein product [Microthlaspi erraticum]